MADQINFTANAYMYGKASELIGKELKYAKNQHMTQDNLERIFPDVFNNPDGLYKVVGAKYLHRRDQDGRRIINFIIENPITHKSTGLIKKYGVIFDGVNKGAMAAFDVVGTTLKEKITAKLNAIKGLFHN